MIIFEWKYNPLKTMMGFMKSSGSSGESGSTGSEGSTGNTGNTGNTSSDSGKGETGKSSDNGKGNTHSVHTDANGKHTVQSDPNTGKHTVYTANEMNNKGAPNTTNNPLGPQNNNNFQIGDNASGLTFNNGFTSKGLSASAFGDIGLDGKAAPFTGFNWAGTGYGGDSYSRGTASGANATPGLVHTLWIASFPVQRVLV